jgi:hypothetical protein
MADKSPPAWLRLNLNQAQNRRTKGHLAIIDTGSGNTFWRIPFHCMKELRMIELLIGVA